MSELFLSTIFRRLRPPYTLPAKVVYGFSATEPVNYGLTLEVPTGAPLIAAGDGLVDLISLIGGKWRSAAGTIIRSTAVRIDHGKGVKTWVHGLATIGCGYGPITRGTQIGTAQGPCIFFGVEHNGKLQNPAIINPNFGIQDGFLNQGKQRLVRQAPDTITKVFSDIHSLIGSGVRYFFPPFPQQVLFNLDFNGNGTKSGAAVMGSASDVWQVVNPLDFAPLPMPGYYNCYGGTFFPAEQGFFINDYSGARSVVYFERHVLTASSGTNSFFDPMLSTWVGGSPPILNSFSIRNLPGGVYSVYVYTNGGTTSEASTIFAAADFSVPISQTATPVALPQWIEGGNYVKFSLTVSNRGSVTIAVYGYLAGLQALRTAV